MEVDTTTTDSPWTTGHPLASTPIKASRPAERPQLDVEEEDMGDLSEIPEPQDSTNDPAGSVTVATESSQLL